MSDGVLLRCTKLEVGHGGKALLPAIDLEIRAGEMWTILGRNGAGKTTLLRTMLHLLPVVRGEAAHSSGLRASYIPQRSSLDDLYPLRARDIVRMGIDRGGSFFRPRVWGEPPAVLESLSEVGARPLASRLFRTLSEGQKQRVLLARLLASRAELVVLDEPTAAMDIVAEREAFALLDRLRRDKGLAVVIVSHDLGVARDFADHAMLVDRETQTLRIASPQEIIAHEVFRLPPSARANESESANG